MPDGQNGALDFWNFGADDAQVSVAPLSAPVSPPVPQYERPTYVLEPFKWGSGTRGTSGGTITWSMGAQIPTDAPYTSSVRTISAEFQATIRAAFARWDAVGNFTFVEVADSSTANMSVVFDELAAEGSGTLGIANTSYIPSTGETRRVFVRFDIGRTWRNMEGTSTAVGTASSTTYNLYAVALHEIGHALGLDHEDDYATLMNAYYTGDINDLTNDEIAGIQALYGTGGQAPVQPPVAPADDYAASTSTTGTVAVGGSVTGTIGSANDVDWFRVTLTAGVTYRIDLRGTTLADPLLGLRNSSGTRITSDDDSGTGLDSLLSYTPTTTGTYYIDAQSATSSGTGTYTLSVTQTSAADDYAGSVATTGTLAVGGTTAGIIETASDSDWFRVTLTAGVTYRINLNGITLADTWLVLRNSSGTQITLDHDSGAGLQSQITYTPTSTGTYYLDAQGYLPSHTGTYSLSLTQTSTADDYAGTTATTGALTAGGSVTGNIETVGDNDWFRITLTAGTSYRFDLRAGTLHDPYLTLLNSGGTSLATNDDTSTSLDSQLTYTPTTTGVYYLSAKSAPAATSGTGMGTYTLTATLSSAVDDYAASSATTGALIVGGSATGTFETSQDADWFRVSLTAGVSYQIDVRGSASSGGTMVDPSLSLYSFTGAFVTSDTDSGTGADARLTFTPTTSGTYYVSAEALFAGTGTYTVSVALAQSPDLAATTATTGSIAAGATLSSSIEQAGDVDWIRVTLTGGTLYRFDGRGTATFGGTLADPIMSVLNSTGTVLRTDNNSGADNDAQILYTPSATGTYYIAMSSTSATATGTYTVGVTANPDDFTATTATAGVASVGSSTSGTVETAGDRDWFRALLTAGTSYAIEVRGTSPGSGVRWTESSVVLRNATGTQVGAATQSGLGAAARLIYTPTTSGAFYIDALAYNTGVGAYTVTVTTASASTAPAPVADSRERSAASQWTELTAPPSTELMEIMGGATWELRQESAPSNNLFTALATPPEEAFFAPPDDQQLLNATLRAALAPSATANLFNIF